MKKLYVVLIVIASFTVGIFFANTTSSPHTSGKTSSTMNQNSSDNVVLDLRGKNLTEVSSAIYTKTETTTLLLSNNSIQMLPSQMGRMTKVTVFKIDHNQLKDNLKEFKLTGSPLRTAQVSKLKAALPNTNIIF